MFKQLKSFAKRFPFAVAFYTNFHKLMEHPLIRNVRDVLDSYFFKGQKAVVTPFGFKLQGSSSKTHCIMQQGLFEVEETELIQRHLKQSEVFIDVGANIGYYSCLARSLGKTVVAIEPLTDNLNHLYANLIENSWNDVEVFPLGLSDRPGLAVLYGASSTGASLISNWAGASKGFRRVISLSTLDILLGGRFVGKKLFIKIDVEGVEHQVLMGAVNTMELMPRPTWLIEISLSEFHPSGLNPNYAATFEMFWQRGYEVHTADHHNILVLPQDIERWLKARRCEFDVFNYIITPGPAK